MAASEPRRPSGLADLPVNVWLVGQAGLVTQRQGRYGRASLHGHPGKMRPELARRLIDTFSRPGDWVLDPMSGIGTTGVEAVHMDRHFVGIEWEARYVAWQRQNLRQARVQGATGRFAVFEGDARRLDRAFPRPRLAPLHAAPGDPGKPGPVDLVLLSPPYADRLGDRRGLGLSPFTQKLLAQRPRTPTLLSHPYGRGQGNVGNLRSAAYWQAMGHVYAGSYQVLRPGGLLVVVLQPNRRGPALEPLHHETARRCQGLGFQFLDEIVAVLGRVVAVPGAPAHLVGHASFWRRLATARLREAGWPVTLNQLEVVLVFRKPAPPPDALPTTKAASRPPLPARDPAMRTAVTTGVK